MAIKITPDEYKIISKYVNDISGIILRPGKEYLVETRLNTVLEEFGCASYSEFFNRIKMDRTQTIEKKVIDTITTAETYFFRDKSPFELLKHKILPDHIDRQNTLKEGNGNVNIHIWSAASATGQELYSLAIVLKELLFDVSKYDIKLLGTDISNKAIAKASYGSYNKFEVARGLSKERLQKNFNQDESNWKIKDEIRAMTFFRKMNLMDPFIGLGKFHIILFRNVAIYFDQELRRKLYEKIAYALAPDGYLIIGSTESLVNDTSLFVPKKYLNSVFYQLK